MDNKNLEYTEKVMSNVTRELHKSFLLLWRLFKNPRTPLWAKIIPVAAILYWLNPIDPIPFPLLDDVIALLIGYKLFIDAAPDDLVDSLRRKIDYGEPNDDNDAVIDATYRVLDDDQ